MESRLSRFKEDILKETMKVGVANAINALAKLTTERIDISVPHIKLSPIEDIPDYVGKTEEIVSIILHQIVGDISGFILLAFPSENAEKLAKRITGNDTLEAEEGVAALKEVGNIISGSCFAALNKFLGITIEHSVPSAAADMTGALLSSIVAEMGQHSNDALITELEFETKETSIEGRVLLILDPDSTQRILQAARKKLSSN